MNGVHRAPGPELAPFVEFLWEYESEARAHAFERLLPDAASALIVDLDEECVRVHDGERLERFDEVRGTLITGAHSRSFAIPTDRPARVVGVAFRVGGAAALFGLPASEVRDRHVALEDLWGVPGRRLRERLLEEDAATSRLERLESLLLERLRAGLRSRAPVRHPAVAHALRAFTRADSSVRVSAVVDALGLSARRFIELFEREVGLTPKLFCRVQRFQRAARRIWAVSEASETNAASEANDDYTTIALDCGFSDQSHLIRDFREFSGLTPADYASRHSHHPHHVPLG